MNQSLESTLVLCDLDNLLLGADGNLTQVVRDVLQLFSSRGGRFTVFSQRSPRAVRSILGSVRLAAPALVCGGTMAYHYADGTRQPLCQRRQPRFQIPAIWIQGILNVEWILQCNLPEMRRQGHGVLCPEHHAVDDFW